MPEIKALCFIDSRRSPEFYSFQRMALIRALKPRFSEIEFLALVQNSADRIHIDEGDTSLVAKELDSFAALLDELKERSTDSDWIIFSEPNVYPDTKWADILAEKKTKASVVSHPSVALTLNWEKQFFFFDQSASASDSDWITSLRFCFATMPESLEQAEVDFRRYPIGDLRESFIQLFRSRGLTFEPARNSLVHVVFSPMEHLPRREHETGYFHLSAPKKNKRRDLGLTIDELAMKEDSAQAEDMTLSDAIKAELRELGKFDSRWSRISKTSEQTRKLKIPYYPEEILLRKICAAVPRVDYVLVLHQLRRGGSEKEGVLHANAYRKLFPSHRIAVILTSPLDPDLEWQLPKDIDVIELGKEFAGLRFSSEERSYFLYRLLDQLNPQTIHVKGSEVGWEMLTNFGPALKKKSKLLANLYCVDYLQDGTPISFGFNHLPRMARTLTCLLADNQNVLNQMKSLTRVPTRKVAYPVEIPKRKWSPPGRDEPFRILWCSRLSFQKSINQLLLAASVFKNYEFHVYGEQADTLPYLEAFSRLPNLTYWGLFDNIEQVDLSHFHCFLYTSFWDGLPNILLEVGTHGMPVISPRVGGIGEILNEQNSFLYDSGPELLRILNIWSGERAEAAGRRLRDDIAEAHTWEHFLDECRVIYGS